MTAVAAVFRAEKLCFGPNRRSLNQKHKFDEENYLFATITADTHILH